MQPLRWVFQFRAWLRTDPESQASSLGQPSPLHTLPSIFPSKSRGGTNGFHFSSFPVTLGYRKRTGLLPALPHPRHDSFPAQCG